MKRRKFFKNLVIGLFFATLIGIVLPLEEKIWTPYDVDYFQASERIVFLTPEQGSLNIIPKQGKSLDIKLYLWGNEDLNNPLVPSIWISRGVYFSVSDSLEIPFSLPPCESPLPIHYRIEYKDVAESSWKSTPQRNVRSPFKPTNAKFEVIFLSDDHTPDDADLGDFVLQDPYLRELRLNGDLTNLFLGKLLNNPAYTPRGELGSLMQAFCYASTLYQIQQKESPDLIVNLGDTCPGFDYRWPGLGARFEEIDKYERIFRLGFRKKNSLLSPTVPIYWALGNHDGEAEFDGMRDSAIKYRKKYFKLPDNGGSSDENYFFVLRGNSLKGDKTSVLIVVLDVTRYNSNSPKKPEDWTLGTKQKEWLKKVLQIETNYKFVVGHHVLGGWPAGSNESEHDYAYGRGPLFTVADYKDFCKNPNAVEQVELTQLMLDNGVDAFIYGHDHIFHTHEIGINSKGRMMRSLCVGSTKYNGERQWYSGPYWRRFYGNFGEYGGYDKNWWPDRKVDFWGPSGYTKLTITDVGVEVSYIRSAYHHRTNIPPRIMVGDVIQKVVW